MKNVILIVEDETYMLNALTDKFKNENFHVLQARDGREGLKVALREKPDIIILDLLMPTKGGMETLKDLRESGEWGKKVPVVVLTNLDPNDDILKGVTEWLPSYYFIKSDIGLREVVERVKEILK